MTIYPTITYCDVSTALRWLKDVFGFGYRIFGDIRGGAIEHAALIYGGGMVMVESERPSELHGSHAGHGWVYVAVDDIDGHYQRAKAAGAEILNEPHETMDGNQRGYSARDLECNLWTFGVAMPRP